MKLIFFNVSFTISKYLKLAIALKMINNKICLSIVVINLINGYTFDLANCPLYIQEPCNKELIRFILSMPNERKLMLDPFKPILPYDFNKTLPLKILIHGYGGLTIDRTISNVTLAYEFKGYNVVIGDILYYLNNFDINALCASF